MKRLTVCFFFLFSFTWLAQSQQVVFSHRGGFYEDVFNLSLSCATPDVTIHYTLNGATPSAQSPEYRQPLTLDETLYAHSDFFKIRTTSPDEEQYVPNTVQKVITIRAAAFNGEGNRCTPVVTQTYLIQSLGCDFGPLPVVSLCVDSLSLFDYDTGIYVPGTYWRPDAPDRTGNYYQRGEEWERLANVEFYDVNNLGFNQQTGVRIHGDYTRRLAQKGMTLYARRTYGDKYFRYPVFEDLPIGTFKRLVLKPFLAAWQDAGIQECLSERMARSLKVDALASRPIVLFINGEYWGIYFIQEKPDEHYIEDHYDIDSDDCNVVEDWAGHSDEDMIPSFINLMTWLQEHHLDDSLNYAYVSRRVDIGNFIDYQILEMFIANTDWPANNMRCWQAGNSPWRWMFFDGDACFRFSNYESFQVATDSISEGWPTNAEATLLFRRLLENDGFRERFLLRFGELMNNELSYNRAYAILEELRNIISGQIKNQSERFGQPRSYEHWTACIGRIDKFLRQREPVFRKEVESYFELSPTPQVLDMRCYPNPFVTTFRVKFKTLEPCRLSLCIYDLWGRLCSIDTFYCMEGEYEKLLNVDLPAGSYVVCLGDSYQKVVRVNK